MNDQFVAALIVIVAAVLMGVVLLVSISRMQFTKTLDKHWYREQWEGIKAQAEDGSAGRQLAIMNGDKLLDRAMKDKGLRGENMGQRLKKNSSRFTKLNDVWAAHKLRNRFAHESDVKVIEKDVKRALKGFEQGLRDLGAL